MITEIRNGLNVKRFHTTNRVQEETVGHHSANVASILLRLSPGCSRNLLIAALMHDVAECFTGDVPAPFKWDNPDAAQGLKDGERAYEVMHSIPMPKLTEHEASLLKLADMLDLVLSSMEDVGRGNSYALQLIVNGEHYIKRMDIYEKYASNIEQMIREVKATWTPTIYKSTEPTTKKPQQEPAPSAEREPSTGITTPTDPT